MMSALVYRGVCVCVCVSVCVCVCVCCGMLRGSAWEFARAGVVGIQILTCSASKTSTPRVTARCQKDVAALANLHVYVAIRCMRYYESRNN